MTNLSGSFPPWLDALHFLNLLFLTLLARSGLQILSAFPRLYWHDGCTPGREVIWFHRGDRSARDVGTSLDEELDAPAWLALPGGKALGLGRHWHFVSLLGWITTGVVYVTLLFATHEWPRLVPTSFGIFPAALSATGQYFHLQLPPDQPGLPYNALQQLSYFGVVFLLAPFQIATGAAMSPAVIGAAPWYAKIFGGRQRARTLHFAGLLAFLSFVLVHTAMVIVHGVGSGMAKIVLADPAADGRLAIVIGAAGLALVILIHVAGTFFARRDPRAAQLLLAPVVDFIERQLSSRLRSRQAYPRWAISPYHWVNGRPPNGVPARVELSVEGLVEHPLRLSVDDLRAMPVHSQVVLHNCIQGWSAVAEWTGVSLSELLDRAGPLPGARYVAFWAIDGSYYETLPLEIARRNQSILAYSMNGRPLPLEHGAPLRLRVENQLGFKMVKWLARIELVDDFRKLGQGQGGWREDHMQYSRLAGI